MPIVFLENDDSLSRNVVDLLPPPVEVRPGRAAASERGWLGRASALVIGPGPTDPGRAGLLDVVREAAARRVPTLGICLGHQAIGMAFGARLVRVPPVHGKTSTVRFVPSRSFPGIVGEHEVMRYHSLAVNELPEALRAVATTADGIVMALEHVALPLAGLQFHPDSYASPTGRAIVGAFLAGRT